MKAKGSYRGGGLLSGVGCDAGEHQEKGGADLQVVDDPVDDISLSW